MPSSNPNPTALILTAIIHTLANEMNNLGTNPTGRLPTIKSVDASWINTVPGGAYPYVGVTPTRDSITSRTVGIRSRDSNVIWHIVVATKSTVSQADALAQLFTALNDGAGNGVFEVLNDPANFTLDHSIVNLTITRVVQTDYSYDLVADKNSGTSAHVAYGIIEFQTTARIYSPDEVS